MNNDWLIVIIEKEYENCLIKKIYSEIKGSLGNWRTEYKNNLAFIIFDNRTIKMINKISRAVDSSQLMGIIKINKNGKF